jgi:hypothetical protein
MKVYFSGALYQKDKFIENYNTIVSTLNKLGCSVFEDTTKVTLKEAVDKTDQQRVDYYKQVIKWIDKCDLVVVEASFPSTLSIGHEISLAIEKGKPVVVLYEDQKEPTFMLGLQNDKLVWVKYEKGNLNKLLADAIEDAKKKSDVRFNFFVSPKILSYLDWVAKKRMIPRSVFLRDLIEKEMRKDKEFKE